MEITLNGTKKDLAEKTSVQQLLDIELPEKQKGIAVAVNNTVIPRASWIQHALNEGDKVLIIKATQGG